MAGVTTAAWASGRVLRLGLDTGVELNVLSPEIMKSISYGPGALQNKTVLGLNGETNKTPSATVENLQVGELNLPPMKAVFMPLDALNKLSGPDLDGLLGQEFLKHFRITFNFKKKEIYLWDKGAIFRDGSLAKKN